MRELTLEGRTRRVYVAGSGPAVIVMAEMPGISPDFARFTRWVKDAGSTVYMPSLFGRDGAVPGADEGAEVFRRACVSAEFRAFAGGSPVRSRSGSECWRGSLITSAVVPGSEPSACASPGTSRSR